ncbi:lipocalin family protein [Polluticaenibacter yanchengensis]|uniref:Lipocalin family protein n=1 Tax=Polluticaenibacter yanchengensis TaxID=3014562 RepID=A0ABT4UNG4_9BACT|nr:lipocalin family protein [Chitinophagaceae bacterium LY-5]
MNLKNIIKGSLVLGIASLTLIACDKDDNDNLPEKVKLLIDKDWKIKKANVIDASNNATSVYKDCMKDDVLKFNTTNYSFSDGTTACDSTILPYYSSTYTINTTTDSLFFKAKATDKIHKMKILKLSADSLIVRWTDNTVVKELGFVNK